MMLEQPNGWPGRTWVEGRTLIQLPDVDGQAEPRIGPGSKENLPVFHNSATAGNRTRSVLLMADALENDWLIQEDKSLRALDGLAASALRTRRWMNELPTGARRRLLSAANDIDGKAMSWAAANHRLHPPVIRENFDCLNYEEYREGLQLIHRDLRITLAKTSWQWIDIDPFGSPMPFIDAALQSLGRVGVLEISATDTAALCGSSNTSAKRRYGIIGVVDQVRHDTAIRVLLSQVAQIAARHDRVVEPVLSMFDGHHVRVSVLVRKSKTEGAAVMENIGWRVKNPTSSEIKRSIDAELHPFMCPEMEQPRCFLPWDDPPELNPERVSGPLWTGPLGNSEIMSRLTEERAIQYCGLLPNEDSDRGETDRLTVKQVNWDEKQVELANRNVRKAVSGIAQSAVMSGCNSLVTVDELPAWTGLLGPPSPKKLVDELKRVGFEAAVAVLPEPGILTDAPWNILLKAVKTVDPN